LAEVPSACVSALLLRRAALADAGLFDASFRAFYEDPDWCFQARLRGWTIAAAPRTVVYHKFNAHWAGRSSRFSRAARNRLRLVIKTFRGRLLGAFLRSYIKEDAKTILSLAKKGRLLDALVYSGAYLSLAVYLPRDLVKRLAIQHGRRREVGIEDILDLNPVPWSCLSDENIPRLDASMYFYFYRRFFR
jgi:GT2 family glycosyltransferase